MLSAPAAPGHAQAAAPDPARRALEFRSVPAPVSAPAGPALRAAVARARAFPAWVLPAPGFRAWAAPGLASPVRCRELVVSTSSDCSPQAPARVNPTLANRAPAARDRTGRSSRAGSLI